MKIIMSPAELLIELDNDKFNSKLMNTLINNIKNNSKIHSDHINTGLLRLSDILMLCTKETRLTIYDDNPDGVFQISNHTPHTKYKNPTMFNCFIIEYIKLKVNLKIHGKLKIYRNKSFMIE